MRRELTVELDEALAGPDGVLSATLVAPAEADPGAPVLVCLPGGTYDRGYFDLQVPGRAGYSFAEAAVDRGLSVVTVDNLGTGASARPDRDVSLADQATAASASVARLTAVVGDHGPIIGVGHSMGGWLVVLAQATTGCFDAVAILGTTNHHVAPLDLPAEMLAAAATREGRAALVEQTVAGMPQRDLEPDRSATGDWFHLPDVPADVLAADATTLTCVPRRVAAEGIVPGIAVEAAGRVDVPVFLAYGEVDVSPAPHTEPSFYAASPDVTLMVLAGSAHCHNMAGTRARLWARLLSWCSAVTLAG